jgi:hypothetical protein
MKKLEKTKHEKRNNIVNNILLLAKTGPKQFHKGNKK